MCWGGGLGFSVGSRVSMIYNGFQLVDDVETTDNNPLMKKQCTCDTCSKIFE